MIFNLVILGFLKNKIKKNRNIYYNKLKWSRTQLKKKYLNL